MAGRGWSGVENGALLKLASSGYDAFITMDRRLPDQNPIFGLPFAVVLVLAPTNRLAHLEPLVPAILEALNGALLGELSVVGE